MFDDHNRYKVIHELQHLLEHELTDFTYTHPALPNTIINASQALDYVFNILYPRIQPSVDDVTQLPVAGNILYDQRIVQNGRLAILSAGINSDLVNGVLETLPTANLSIGDEVRLGNVSIDKTAGFPDGKLYIGAITAAPETVTLYEDIGLLTLADLSGLGLVDGPVEVLTNDSIDGENAEIWMWSQMEDQGQGAPQWNKIADIDWGINSVVQALMDQTQYLYVRKFGITDYDPVTELPFAGDLAGQHIYGGDTAGQNLILHANNGDILPAHTGAIVFDDPAKPLADLAYDFGAVAQRWDTGYFGTLVIGTASITITDDGTTGFISTSSVNGLNFAANDMLTTGDFSGTNVTGTTSLVGGDVTISNGSIVSSSGAITFGNENLSTTGTLASDAHTITDSGTTETLIFDADGDTVSSFITSSLGSIDFGASALITTGAMTVGDLTADSLTVDLTLLDNNTISTSAGNFTINPSGTLDVQSSITIGSNNITGIAGSVITADQLGTVGGLQLFQDRIISTTGEILFDDHLIPNAAGVALGKTGAGNGFQNLFMHTNGALNDVSSGQAVSLATLITLRDILLNEGLGPGAPDVGDIIVWNGTKWISSNPDAEIQHEELLNLDNGTGTDGDAGHGQFVQLTGRTGGQFIQGGVANGDQIRIRANSGTGNTKGIDIPDTGTARLDPATTDVHDLGSGLKKWNNIHMLGQGIGFRVENAAKAAIDAAALPLGGEGRIWYEPTEQCLYVDTGIAAKKIKSNSFDSGILNETAVLGGILNVAGIDVSSTITDARNAIWQVIDISNNHEIMDLNITKNGTNVFVTVGSVNLDLPSGLPAGSYKLIGIEL